MYIAIDLTLIPYHGECYEDEKEIVRSQPKSGTTHFHGYATVSIVHDNQRFVEKGESMEKIVAWLLIQDVETAQNKIYHAYACAWKIGWREKVV